MAGKKPVLHTTSLWDFSSQQYGNEHQGDSRYTGATPSYLIWNLLQRYTKKKDLIVDPMCGSGTTVDVARDLKRRALGYDVSPVRKDIFRSDARKLPLEDRKADFVFVDPPYLDHLKYSGDKNCIGELSGELYYEAMAGVFSEINRILKSDRYMALYVSDSFKKGKGFEPLGFRLFSMLEEHFTPVDIIAVTRRNKKLEKNNWHRAALEQNFFLRGFNYLFIFAKPSRKDGRMTDRRPPEQTERLIADSEWGRVR